VVSGGGQKTYYVIYRKSAARGANSSRHAIGTRVMYVIARNEATKQSKAAHADAAALIEATPRS
jgi:hypothetical protein